MDQLHRTGGSVGTLDIALQRFAGGVDQQRTHAFAAIHDAVAHGLVEPFEFCAWGLEQGVQGSVDAVLAALLVRRDHAVSSESRSEEHTSELQSRENLVCRLL